MVSAAALDKLLHDCRGFAGFASLHATVRLIDDEIQPVALIPDGISQRLPYRIGATITILRELRCNRELLRV